MFAYVVAAIFVFGLWTIRRATLRHPFDEAWGRSFSYPPDICTIRDMELHRGGVPEREAFQKMSEARARLGVPLYFPGDVDPYVWRSLFDPADAE